MAQPNYGEVRIITNDGFGDDIVSIRNLAESLERSSSLGDGIVELATPIAKQQDQNESDVEKSPCPADPKCNVFVTINRNRGRVFANTKNGIPIPEDCIQCAGKRVLSVAGFITNMQRASLVATDEV